MCSSLTNIDIIIINDCGGISEDEWKIIENKFGKYL